MPKQFHSKEFDPSTRLKLDIFRRYVREWIPVFLSGYKAKPNFPRMCLFDLFSGPGMDTDGNPGTPIIILEELQNYCSQHANKKSSDVKIELFFNDVKRNNTNALTMHLNSIRCQKNCCEICILNSPFEQLLQDQRICQPLASKDAACLVILDQFGIKHVDTDVFQFFSKCPTTDLLFFISSSFVKRFADDPSFNTRLPIKPEEIKATDIKNIHRKLCENYKSIIPANIEYYLSHFSILKEKNIYGIIFGSKKLLGLEKFLKVAWEVDNETGEANYDIDNDPIRSNHGSTKFFPEMKEMNSYKKVDLFEDELRNALIRDQMSNVQLYRFCLERGFLPNHVNELLKKWHEKNDLLVIPQINSRSVPRKGCYYIGWKYYDNNDEKLVFRIKE